jgi:hypothetical protein
MANSCELFGGIVPNVFVDRVFLESSSKVIVNLKLIDVLKSNQSFSLLSDALEIETKSETINLRKYFKIWCIAMHDQDTANLFEAFFKNGGLSADFNWESTSLNSKQYISKTLEDFTSSYTNADGNVELIHSFEFGIDSLEHLTVFAYVQLDTETLQEDLGLDLPESLLGIFGTINQSLIIQDSQTVSSIVQDFRIREEVTALVTELDKLRAEQSTFPEQRDILNQAFSNNSYFSEFFVTKDKDRKSRFYFAFDYGKYVLEKSKYSALIVNMSETAKKEITNESEILQFIVSRKQVSGKPARNSLGSPVRNSALSNETAEVPVILSLDDSRLNEISLILSDQPNTSDSFIRHFTGLDTGMEVLTDGYYQYSVNIEVMDGYVPVVRRVLSSLATAVADYEKYVARTQIPGVYDEKAMKFTIDGQRTMEGKITNKWSDKTIDIESIVDIYMKSLGYFVDFSESRLRGKILDMISPTTGSIDGVLLFSNLLNQLLGQINDVLSVGSNSVGVEATRSNRAADSISSFKLNTSQTREVFDNTIGARFINEIYVDKISPGFGQKFDGLSVYTTTDLSNAATTEVTPFNSIKEGSQESMESEGIVFKLAQDIPALSGENLKNSSNYLGGNSPGAENNLNTTVLSAADQADLNINDFQSVPPEIIASFSARQEPTKNQLKTEVDVLVGFIVPEVVESGQYQQEMINKLMIREPKFETKQLGELTTAVSAGQNTFYLCRQDRQGDKEVINSFFFIRPSATFEQNITGEAAPTITNLGTGLQGNITQAGIGAQAGTTLQDNIPTEVVLRGAEGTILQNNASPEVVLRSSTGAEAQLGIASKLNITVPEDTTTISEKIAKGKRGI